MWGFLQAKHIALDKKINVFFTTLADYYSNSVKAGVVQASDAEQAMSLIYYGLDYEGMPTLPMMTLLLKKIQATYTTKVLVLTGAMAVQIGREKTRALCGDIKDSISIGLDFSQDGIKSIVADNSTGMYDSVSHLIETHGCRSFAFIGHYAGHPESEMRLAATRQALADHQLDPNTLLVTPGQFFPDNGHDGLNQLLVTGKLKTLDALVCVNDTAALEILEDLQRLQLFLPVIGFDNVLEAEEKGLTTVGQPLGEMGFDAVRMTTNPVSTAIHQIPSPVFLRTSCGCPPGDTERSLKEIGQQPYYSRNLVLDFVKYLNVLATKSWTEMHKLLTISLRTQPCKAVYMFMYGSVFGETGEAAERLRLFVGIENRLEMKQEHGAYTEEAMLAEIFQFPETGDVVTAFPLGSYGYVFGVSPAATADLDNIYLDLLARQLPFAIEKHVRATEENRPIRLQTIEQRTSLVIAKSINHIGCDGDTEADLLADALLEKYPDTKRILIAGVLGDKQYREYDIVSDAFSGHIQNKRLISGFCGAPRDHVPEKIEQLVYENLRDDPTIDTVFVNADIALPGVVRALSRAKAFHRQQPEHPLHHLRLVGYTNTPEAMRLVQEGVIQLGLLNPLYRYGYLAAFQMIMLAAGLDSPIDSLVFLNPELVTPKECALHWTEQAGFLERKKFNPEKQKEFFNACKKLKEQGAASRVGLLIDSTDDWYSLVVCGAHDVIADIYQETGLSIELHLIDYTDERFASYRNESSIERWRALIQYAIDESGVQAIALRGLNVEIQDMLNDAAIRHNLKVVTLDTKPYTQQEVSKVISSEINGRKELRRANEALKKLAETDPLTGLANRRVLIDAMSATVADRQPCACIMADIDYFKQFNDLHGHATGDLVLQSVADVLKRYAVGGLAARYGGEEFTVFLPGKSMTDAFAIAEQIRQSVADLTISTQQDTLQVHISLGVSGLGTYEYNDKLCDTLLAQADQALYMAKGQGRNQTTLYERKQGSL